MLIDFNYKYENSPKVYGNIYIQVSKIFDYELPLLKHLLGNYYNYYMNRL